MQECAKQEKSDAEKRNDITAEQTATLYFCDDDDDYDNENAVSKENEYGSYPLPDY